MLKLEKHYNRGLLMILLIPKLESCSLKIIFQNGFHPNKLYNQMHIQNMKFNRVKQISILWDYLESNWELLYSKRKMAYAVFLQAIWPWSMFSLGDLLTFLRILEFVWQSFENGALTYEEMVKLYFINSF